MLGFPAPPGPYYGAAALDPTGLGVAGYPAGGQLGPALAEPALPPALHFYQPATHEHWPPEPGPFDMWVI